MNSPCEDQEASANFQGPACIFQVEILTSRRLQKLCHLLKAPFSAKLSVQCLKDFLQVEEDLQEHYLLKDVILYNTIKNHTELFKP